MAVRYYGLWSATRRADLDHARDLLPAVPAAAPTTPPAIPTPTAAASLAPQPVCPRCRAGTLRVIAILRPARKVPP